MKSNIKKIVAREIIDSRGNPTLEAEVFLESGSKGRAAVPSGASTGSREALELRDSEVSRFDGKGVLSNVEFIRTIINDALVNLDSDNQELVDKTLIDLDGTDNKSKLGANTLLAVSLANAKSSANNNNISLYRSIKSSKEYIMPVPMMNIINGGSHANNSVDIQEFMIMPVGASSLKEAVRYGAEVFHTLGQILDNKKYITKVSILFSMISSDFFRLLFDREFTIASEMLSEEYGLKTFDGLTTSLTYSLQHLDLTTFYMTNILLWFYLFSDHICVLL